jgi:hypothetical protein
MGYHVGKKNTKMYKIPKLVHFRSTLILNENNKTHRRKPTVGPWHTNSMSQNRMHEHGKTTKKHYRKKIQPKKLSVGAERS